MAITACFVTRNHEGCLARALRSVVGVAGEAVVVDTGSTDRTVAVARENGAKVVPVTWADDFSAACNAALDHATGGWVLWMNPDEELNPTGNALVALAVATPGAFAYRLRVMQELSPDRPGQGTSNLEVRLFRRTPEVRFHGRLHPRLAPPIEEVAAAHGEGVGAIDVMIHRHAYLSQPTPEKMRWMVRLLEAELRDRPGQLPFLIELGRNLLWLNDPRGHEVLAEAAAAVKAQANDPEPPTPAVGSLLEYLLTVSPDLSRSRVTRDEARDLAGRWFSHAPPVVWALSAERFQAADYAGAATHLERLLEMGRTGAYDSAVPFTPQIIGPLALLNLGLCNIHLGRWDEAKRCFSPLLTDPTHKDAASRGYALAEKQSRGG